MTESKSDNKYYIPFWERYTLSLDEAAHYFRIGEGKIRAIIKNNPKADYVLWNGNRAQIKRKMFEKYVDGLSAV